MKKITYYFFLLPIFSFSQVQIGDDIDGENQSNGSGNSVSLSYNGNIVAIGAAFNTGINGIASGHVRVYEKQAESWIQIGSDIDGEAQLDYSGYSVDLNSDGTIVAIGAINNSSQKGHVRVYQNKLGIWTQLGNDIDGEAVSNLSGWSVSLSADGNIVAIGAPLFGLSGHVRVYKYDTESEVWLKIGQDIDSDIFVSSGWSVSLNADGNVVAIGTPSGEGSTPSDGKARVYKNVGLNWVQIGTDINDNLAGEISETAVSLNADGTILAIGSTGNDNNGVNSGFVRVFKNNSGIWEQIGTGINGEAAGDESGSAISLNAAGNILAIGAPENDNAGHVRIYKNISGNWQKIGNDIDGEYSADESGKSVSLNADGTIVAIGAPENNAKGEQTGHVRVYDLTAILSTESFEKDYFSYYPNPVKNILNINLKQGLDLKKINIYNIQSQYLYSVKKLKIDVSKLSSGIYFIEVETKQGKSTKKIVIE